MGVIIPEDFSQVTMRWSLAGDSEPMVTTLGLYNQLAPGDPIDTADKFAQAYALSDLHSPAELGVGWSRMTSFVTTMLSSGPVTVEAGTAASNTGTHTTVPNNCAILVRKQTPLGGRRNRGRGFFPPAFIAEGDITPNGIITTTEVTAFQALITEFLTQLDAADLVPYLFHSDGGTATPITSMVVQARLATQRQRLRR